jgi:protein FRA10AC1
MRWRTEQEVVLAKGQFVCGNKRCDAVRKLRTWEVNFAYVEAAEKKNALVKVRLCFECSYKLNYHHKRKEVTKKRKKKRDKDRRKKKRQRKDRDSDSSSSGSSSESEAGSSSQTKPSEKSEAELAAEAKDIWSKAPEREEEKSREDVFAEFLEDLFL